MECCWLQPEKTLALAEVVLGATLQPSMYHLPCNKWANHFANIVTSQRKVKEEFSEGLKGEAPFDLIIIDCPQYNFNLDLLSQVNVGGRIIYIEKINEELSKAYKMIKYENNFSKVFLFDVFSNFYLTKQEEGFNF